MVQLATGAKRKVTSFVKNCTVIMDQFETFVKLNVLPLGSYDILIGMDWLEQHGVILNCYDKTFMFGYTGYSQKTEHLEQPLHTNRSHINTPMFVTWSKPSREIVHCPSQIATSSNLLCKRKKVTYELLIIDQLDNDPLCSLNRDHRLIEC